MLRPPVGAAILGFMAFVAGFADVFQGLRFLGVVAFGPGELGSGLALYGAFAVLVGLAWIAVAYGFWGTQSWAWMFGMIMCVFGLINAVLVLFTTGELGLGLAVALLPLVVMWYLQQPDIKRVFGADSSEPAA